MGKTKIALIYDFDKTLAPGNMQEHSFIPNIGISKEDFWKDADNIAKKDNVDHILAYMHYMIKISEDIGEKITRESLREHAREITFFDGVLEWFDEINSYNKSIEVVHYIVSSGLREMVLGTPIAKHFKRCYANDFIYDENGNAVSPGLGINYTNKTQFLYRISKNTLEVHDNSLINKSVPDLEKTIPLSNMIYIGDGETDVPCFKTLQSEGGYGIVVYNNENQNAKDEANKIFENGRVSHIAPANFQKGEKLMNIVNKIMDLVHSKEQLAGIE